MKEKLFQQFQMEVLSKGPEAILPCNLSDKWLDILSEQGDEPGNEDNPMTELLAAVMHLVHYKNDCKDIEIGQDQLAEYVENYKVELSIEEVCRKTEVKIDRATMGTILRDRMLKVYMPKK